MGPSEGARVEGGDISCVNPDISADNLLIVRPPVPPPLEEDELSTLAEASGVVLIGSVPAAVNPVGGAAEGITLMVARGTAAPILLRGTDGSSG
jgi:hypothetical protein